MTGTTLMALGLVLLVLASAIFKRRPGKRAAWLQREAMPQELQTARLIASEKHFRCEHPVALSGTPDQVYQLADGCVVLVDTKRRQRPAVYDADIAQLSIYRVLLAHQKRFGLHPFADWGYIRLASPSGVTYKRVQLWTTDQVIDLHRRYWQLREGHATPMGTRFKGLCRLCGHRKRCGQARA